MNAGFRRTHRPATRRREHRRRLTALLGAAATLGGLLAVVAPAAAHSTDDTGSISVLPGADNYVTGSRVTVQVNDSNDEGQPVALQAVDADTGQVLPISNAVIPMDADETDKGYTKRGQISGGSAYFSVVLVGAGADGAGQMLLLATVGSTEVARDPVSVVADDNDLVHGTTLTKSVGRAENDGSNGKTSAGSTVVVRTPNPGTTPLTLVATPHNPHPPTQQAYGTGFFAAAPDVNISPPTTVQTDSTGTATFEVRDATPDTDVVSYFTPVFHLFHNTVAVPDATGAVIFGPAPNNEAGRSRIALSDPSRSDTLTHELYAPADGTTAAAVYVDLRCECAAPSGTYQDVFGPGGDGYAQMPAVTTQNDNYHGLRGALAEVHPQTPGGHAVITPWSDATSLDVSNDPLHRGQAYAYHDKHNPLPNDAIAVFKVTDSVAEDVTLNAFDATNNVQITAADGDPGDGQVTIHFVAPSPYMAHTTVNASPAAVPADGTTPSHINVTVRDAHDHPISGRTVELSPAVTTEASIQSTSAVTGVDGKAQFMVTDSTAETVPFDVTDQQTGLLGHTTVTFTPAPPSVVNSSISPRPSSVPADGQSTATVTVSLQDGAGNPESGLPVTLDQGSGSSTITPPTATTDEHGRATFTVSDARAEDIYYTADVQAADGSDFQLPSTSPMHFVVGALSAAHSALTADLTSVPADGVSTATLTATLRDARDNPIRGRSLTLDAAGGHARVSSAGAPVTDAAGSVRFTVTDATPEQVTFTATDTTDDLTLPALTVTFTGAPVPSCPDATDPTKCSALTAAPATAAVNGIVRLTAVVRDGNGFPVSGQHLSLTTAAAAYQISQSPTGGVSGGDGTVTFLVSSASPGRVDFTVLDGTTALGEIPVSFFGAPAATHTTITADRSTVPADGNTTATVTVTVHDVNDNPVEDQPVSLGTGTDSTGSTVTPAGAKATDANGIVTFTVSDDQIEQVTYRATAGTLVTDPVTVSFTKPHTEAANSTVIATPGSDVPADGQTAATVTVTLSDRDGAALPNHQVSLSCPTASVTPVNGTSTDSTGAVAFHVTATVAGSVTCTATDSTANVTVDQTPQISFVTPPSEANQSTVAATPTVVPNDGTSAASIVVTLRAADGSIITGHPVSLTASGGHSVITPASVATDSAGRAVFTVTDHTAESLTYVATDTTEHTVLTQQATVSFSDEPTASTAVAAPASVPADGHSAASIVVTLTSAGKPVAGHNVTLVPQNGVSRIRVVTEPTGQDGKAVFKVTDQVSEAVIYRVTDTTLGLTLTAAPVVTFTGSGPAPTVSTLTPTSGPAGTVVTITGHDLAGAVVSFGGVPAQTVTINPEGTVVHATAPGGSGTVHVIVATGGGNVTAGSFKYAPAAQSFAKANSTGRDTSADPHHRTSAALEHSRDRHGATHRNGRA
jgi:hypothetical protein